MVTPGSEQVRATIERDGQMQSLQDINGTVLANACGPCIGQWRRAKEVARCRTRSSPRTTATSRRATTASATTMNFIASPEIVTALALAGRLSFNPLTDTLTGADGKPFKLEAAARRRPKCRRRTSTAANADYIAPPADGSRVKLERRSQQRAAAAHGAVAGVGRQGLLDMPVLLKTKGKTTTDHISPAGPWLSLPRPPRQVQRQHVHGRDQRLHRRGRAR